MNEQKNQFVMLNELARPGSTEYRKLRREANRIGALVSIGQTEYVNQTRYLGFYSATKQARVDTREASKKSSKQSGGRYGNIRSLAKLDTVEKQILKAIAPRSKKIDELSNALDQEQDEAKRAKLSTNLDRLLAAAEDSDTKLKELRARRTELEAEAKARREKRNNTRKKQAGDGKQ